MVGIARATSPQLSLSLVPPATLRFSWPSNYTDWQLMSAPSLASVSWKPVAQVPFLDGNALVELFPFADNSGYFRLQQTNAGGCVFSANPPVITSGDSSTLTWCPVPGVTYHISPGMGVVTGGSLVVTPAETTVYSLIASNATGMTTNITTVLVNPCGFLTVTNWLATLTFSYALAPSASGYVFHVTRHASASFYLTRQDLSATDATWSFTGVAAGTVTITDQEDDSTGGSTVTTKMDALGPPDPSVSTFVLNIDCPNSSYNFAAIVAVDGTLTYIEDGFTDSSPTTDIAGQVVIFPKPLPASGSTISGSGSLPAVGPLTLPSSDYYAPNGFVANDMWINGVITDATAGTADVSWTITPSL